jgi:glycosyltransferase involved in cell wall biosynthesis
MRLSVIIPCLNGATTLGVQLDALAQQQWNQCWEVIVADNGSSDESLSIVQRYRNRLPNLRVVDASARRGQPYALNVGAIAAEGDSLAFVDADDQVAPGWLSAMGEALSKYDCVACRIDLKKLNPSWLEEIFQDHEQQRDGLIKAWYPPYLWHAGGGTLGIKKALHEAIGGFDESLPYEHDTDYCFKVQLRGVEIRFVPEALTYVRCRHSLRALFHQARHWAEYTVLIYKYYRSYEDKRRTPWKTFIRQWKNLFLSIPAIHYKAGRALWIWKLGWQLGILGGSLKHRVPPV